MGEDGWVLAESQTPGGTLGRGSGGAEHHRPADSNPVCGRRPLAICRQSERSDSEGVPTANGPALQRVSRIQTWKTIIPLLAGTPLREAREAVHHFLLRQADDLTKSGQGQCGTSSARGGHQFPFVCPQGKGALRLRRISMSGDAQFTGCVRQLVHRDVESLGTKTQCVSPTK